LHSVLAFEGKTPKIQRGQKEFVPIINVGRKHWVTVTNIGCEDNVVKVYDSKHMELPGKDRNKFYLCLAALLNTSYPNMTIVRPSMQNQKGCSDCGLFAVAVAFSLLIGEDPSTPTTRRRCECALPCASRLESWLNSLSMHQFYPCNMTGRKLSNCFVTVECHIAVHS
jgi:hypothetical protein